MGRKWRPNSVIFYVVFYCVTVVLSWSCDYTHYQTITIPIKLLCKYISQGDTAKMCPKHEKLIKLIKPISARLLFLTKILTSSSFFLNCQFSWAELYHLKKIIKNYQYCLWIHSRNLSFWILNFIWNQTISQYWNYFKLWFSQSQTLEST